MISAAGFAYVEPRTAPTAPILDDLTRKATALWRACTPSDYVYRGEQDCTGRGCTAHSDNHDHYLPDGRETHSLLIHYVACHRDAVSAADLEFLTGLTAGAEPTAEELASPDAATSTPRLTRGFAA